MPEACPKPEQNVEIIYFTNIINKYVKQRLTLQKMKSK
jgi:hypothetical protein